jgi:hypothetical protein
MSTVAFTASTVRSSPSDSVPWASTRTSGSTGDAFNEAVAFVSPYRNARRTVIPGIRAASDWAVSPGKSSRLMGENPSGLTVSSCTSFPVATPKTPIWLAAPSTPNKPTDCSKGSGPVATCDRTSRANGRDCGGLNVTRSLRVSGSNRHSEMRDCLGGTAAPVAESTVTVAAAGSITSVMVAPAGTFKISSPSSPCAGRIATRCAPSITPADGT